VEGDTEKGDSTCPFIRLLQWRMKTKGFEKWELLLWKGIQRREILHALLYGCCSGEWRQKCTDVEVCS
jgi:hypothetical protein